jgi:hypothetical protein
MSVTVVVVGHDAREETLEGFEKEHSMSDLREYWEEHFSHIDWAKGTDEKAKAVAIGKNEPVPWADVANSTLGEMDLEVHGTVELRESHIVG